MAPKHHPTPLSGGDRKALTKELGKARAMTGILAAQSAEMRAKGAALIQQADRLLCESWNERMWSDGEPIDPSPTIDQAINGGFPWLEIQCSRCKTPNDVDLAALKHPPTTFVHDLASRLRCRKCAKAGRRPSAASDAPLPAEYWESVLKDPRADATGAQMRQRRLSEIQRHVLRISCRRCERTVEIQTADAVRLYGGNAVWKDVAQRLLDNTCQQRTGRHEEDGCWPGFDMT